MSMKSIIQTDDWCYLCLKEHRHVKGTERHHCIHGTANRKLADKDGLTVMLCNTHHRRLHDKGEHDIELMQDAQRIWLKHYSKDIGDWIRRYGKNFL